MQSSPNGNQTLETQEILEYHEYGDAIITDMEMSLEMSTINTGYGDAIITDIENAQLPMESRWKHWHMAMRSSPIIHNSIQSNIRACGDAVITDKWKTIHIVRGLKIQLCIVQYF